MANVISGNFAGEKALPYFSCALLELNSLSNGSITIHQNVKGGKLSLRKGSLATVLQDASCDYPTPSDLTLEDVDLVLADLQAAVTICKEEFFNEWEVLQMGDSAWGSTPQDLTDWLIGYLLGNAMAELEPMIWTGAGTAGTFLGFEPQIVVFLDALADNATQAIYAVQNPADALTAANIISKMGLLVALASDSVKSKGDAEIVMSFQAYEFYVSALGGFGTGGIGANGVAGMGTTFFTGQALTYNGYPVRRANGMSSNAMIMTNVSNLHFGTALLSDMTMVKIKDMEESDLSENVRFKAKFTAGVAITCDTDVYSYGIAYTDIT